MIVYISVVVGRYQGIRKSVSGRRMCHCWPRRKLANCWLHAILGFPKPKCQGNGDKKSWVIKDEADSIRLQHQYQ